MRKWYTYIIMLATVLFGSCNLEDTLFPEQECETDDITVRIILSMMDSRANTRAYDPPHEEDYGNPIGNEYYINQYDVEVLVFDEDSNFVERATLVQATSTNFRTYELTGTLSNVVENTSYQMVVLANRSGSAYCSNFPSSFTGTTMQDVLESLVYSNYKRTFTENLLTSGSTERIPMWGVVKSTLVNKANITVNMLRAMAKVRVKMDATTGYTLSSVTLNQANNGGYFTPTMKDGITDGGSTASVKKPRIPSPASGLTTLTNLPFVSEPNSTSSYVIYVPEMATYSGTEIAGTATTWMEVAVKDNNGEDVYLGENNKLYFREYRESDTSTGVVNGSFFNVVRNYFYDYTITGVDDGLNLDFTLNVAPWTLVKKNVNYTETISCTYDGDGLGWSNVTTDIQDNTKIYMNPNGTSAIFKFKIEKPKNPEWFVDLSGEGFDVDTSYQELTGGAIEVTVDISATAVGKYEGILRVFVKEGGRFKEAPGSRYIIVKNYE